MSEPFAKPFTKAEMEAICRATRDEEGLKRRFWDKLKRVAGKIPFAEDLVAAFFCATDPSTPSRVKLILLGAIAYFVFPADAVTDLLPLFGFADDAAVLAAAITQVGCDSAPGRSPSSTKARPARDASPCTGSFTTRTT